MAGLPLADPQFWLVTLVAAAIVVWGIRRWRRSLRAAARPGCARCPVVPGGSGEAPAGEPPPGARPPRSP
jgi:hypothetical protein